MHIYRLADGLIVAENGQHHRLSIAEIDAVFTAADPRAYVAEHRGDACDAPAPAQLLAPIGGQEVWASGVTYYRSRSARMEESADAGGGDFYDRVYAADRPELFFKATAPRVIGPGGAVRIRPDSTWDVPEPELTLAIHPDGRIIGYTIGNDMSSRSIEGENPLYLPQAKCYDGSCALGPALYLAPEPLGSDTPVALEIRRDGAVVFADEITLAQMKRRPAELAEWLCRELSFPVGVYLMTGTGIVPDTDFSLRAGDQIRIAIPPVGELHCHVAPS